MLIDKIKVDLKQAMMDKDEHKKSTLRMVLGEVPRLNLKAGEIPPDELIRSIIRKLIKAETIVIELSKEDVKESKYINTLNDYLPKMMSKEEVCQWLVKNRDIVNLDNFKPQIKAIGVIMKHLQGKADGKTVSEILKWNDNHKKSCHIV